MQQSSQGADYDPNNPYMNLPNQEWRKMQVAYLQVKYKQEMQFYKVPMMVMTHNKNLTLLTIMNKNTAINFGGSVQAWLPFYFANYNKTRYINV